MVRTLHFQLNGRSTVVTTEPDRALLWVLRTNLGLTGTKYGCGESHCGACTVLVNDKPVRSCQTPFRAVDGKQIVTIEGLARDGKLHPLQQAFVDPPMRLLHGGHDPRCLWSAAQEPFPHLR
jgi:aerobic-type carbon monoxide dehydrogenase small subunit (CoxS/CutS family)